MKCELSKKSIFILAALCFSQQAGAQQRSATESNEILRGAIAGAILSQALKNTVSRNVENLDFKTAVTIQQALSFLGHYNGKFDVLGHSCCIEKQWLTPSVRL